VKLLNLSYSETMEIRLQIRL